MDVASNNGKVLNGGAIAGIVVGALVLIVALFALWKRTSGQQKSLPTIDNPVDPSLMTRANPLTVTPTTPVSTNNSAELSHQLSEQPTDRNFSIPNSHLPMPSPQPPIRNLDEEIMTKTLPPLPLPLPPPLPTPIVHSQ